MPFFRKSIITSIHSSFCVLQSPKWYTGSYPLTFRPLLGKCLSLHNCTGFRDKLLQRTFRWRPVDVLAARCSELSADKVWYRMPQSCLLQTHQCGWVSFHSHSRTVEPQLQHCPTAPCTLTGTSSQCRAPSLGSKWLKHVSEVKYVLKVFLPWVGLGLGLTGVFLWVRVEKILFLLCPPLVPFQKIPHFDGNME